MCLLNNYVDAFENNVCNMIDLFDLMCYEKEFDKAVHVEFYHKFNEKLATYTTDEVLKPFVDVFDKI